MTNPLFNTGEPAGQTDKGVGGCESLEIKGCRPRTKPARFFAESEAGGVEGGAEAGKADHDIVEIRIIPHGNRTDVYILFGLDDAERFGGWMRRVVDGDSPAIDCLLHTLRTGDLAGWTVGAPPSTQNREQHAKGKGEGSGKYRQRGGDEE